MKPDPMDESRVGLTDLKPAEPQAGSPADALPLMNPEDILKEGMSMVNMLKVNIKKLQLGYKLRKDVWLREMQSLQSQNAPTTLIAICGATGAGKSSLLNAILDDYIVPTSGMRACTSVVTEISYHQKKTIDADVSFLSKQEWRDELTVLLDDLINEDGTGKRINDLRGDARVAWQKVHAVYPTITQEQLVKLSVDQIIQHDIAIKSILGTTKHVTAIDSRSFTKEIAQYIDSKGQKRGNKDKKEKTPMNSTKNSNDKKNDSDGPAFWPLIRQVKICCNAEALSTGAVLVDLPGVADANAARNSVAKGYMKKSDFIWVLAPISRAIDDKSARDLMGDAFKMQLMMDGVYDDRAITFIATKCDELSCSEVINGLSLEDDSELQEIYDQIQECEEESEKWVEEATNAAKAAEEVGAQLEEAEKYLAEIEAKLKVLKDQELPESRPIASSLTSTDGKKRKNTYSGRRDSATSKKMRSSLDPSMSLRADKVDSCDPEVEQDDNEMEVTVRSLQIKKTEALGAIQSIVAQLSEYRKQKMEATDMLAILAKKQVDADKEKSAFCSMKRSEYSCAALKEDFRQGLKDLDEQHNPGGLDPTVNIRNYEAIDLPVFACSSRDYMRLIGQMKGDGHPSCFSKVEDTGILQVKTWCHQLTVSSRERAARNFLIHLKTFASSVQTYVQGIGDVTSKDRLAMQMEWESTHYAWATGGVTPRLTKDFKTVIDACVCELKQSFKDGLEEKCRAGAVNAAAVMVQRSDAFASSMPWQTYRATLRRHGSWRLDLNAELTNPFTHHIASSWSKVFEADLFSSFEEAAVDAVDELLADVEASAAVCLKRRVRDQRELSLDEARGSLRQTLDVTRKTMDTEQKEITRALAQDVQERLALGYDHAMKERGAGSVAREKAVFHEYVDNIKDKIFKDAAGVLMDRLSSAAETVGKTLEEASRELAEKIEVSIAVLWESPWVDPEQIEIRKDVVSAVNGLLEKVQLWQDADSKRQSTATSA